MYIGVDGGGTKTKAVLCDQNLNIIKSITTGPSSIRTVPFKEAISNLKTAIETVMNQSVKSVFIGLGDVASSADEQRVRHALMEIDSLQSLNITVKNDVYNAHAAAFNGKEGILLIVGTGSVAFGIDEMHHTVRVGGYSYKAGDGGSAFSLGMALLKKLPLVFDGRQPSSPLIDKLFIDFSIKSPADIIDCFETLYLKRSDVASLAPLINEYAAINDTHALSIVDEGVKELLNMVETANEQLSLSTKDVIINGTLGTIDGVYKDRLFERLTNAGFSPKAISVDAAIGSVILAKQKQTL